jgi:rubrerythrin
MAGFDSVEEILEYAIAREVEAVEFYRFLAGVVENPEIRDSIMVFAREETEHKAKLELELIKRGRVVSEPDNLADFNITDYMTEGSDYSNMNYAELLMLAIRKEETAFRLYVALAGMAGDMESQDVLMALAQEETKHKMLFETEYDRVMPGHH